MELRSKPMRILALVSIALLTTAAAVGPALAQPGSPGDGADAAEQSQAQGNQTGNQTADGNQTSDGNQTDDPADGNQTSGNQTDDGNQTEMPEGNQTDDGNQTDMPDGNMTTGNQTDEADGNATDEADGNETDDGPPPWARSNAVRAAHACSKASEGWTRAIHTLENRSAALRERAATGNQSENGTAGMLGAADNIDAVIEKLQAKIDNCGDRVEDLEARHDAVRAFVEERRATRGPPPWAGPHGDDSDASAGGPPEGHGPPEDRGRPGGD